MAATSVAWRFREPLCRICRVVFAGPHFQAGLQFTRECLAQRKLDTKVQLIHAPTHEELMESAPIADVALPFMQRFDGDFIQKAPNLRLIMQYGVGLEGVDVPEATKQGVAVANIPAAGTGNAEATAEHALLLSLSLLRQATHELPRRFRVGQLGGLPIPRSLFKKNVTVVGYGAVGSTLCRYLDALGANVTAVRRRDWCDKKDKHVTVSMASSLEQVLPTTDLLILACTMTPETWHLMSHKTLALLPHGALVVNVGRGPLVEHGAILEALESGAVGGFASDVGVGHPTKPSEPWDPEDMLSKHPNTLFTPHVGGYSDYSYGLMVHSVVDAIECVMEGKPPKKAWVNGE